MTTSMNITLCEQYLAALERRPISHSGTNGIKNSAFLYAITGKTSHNDVGQAVPLRFEIVVTRKTEAENQSLHRFSSLLPFEKRIYVVEQMQTPEIWNWWLCLILLLPTQ
jgi:hypothetical protein